MGLVELIIAVHQQLERAAVSHAFGGALALAYVAEPRGTADIDVNVFLPADELSPVVVALGVLGYRRADPAGDSLPIAGIRFAHEVEPFPVDVFPSLHDRYREAERRRILHPFGRGDDILPFLSAEDLCVFKVSFGRPKDWVDLVAIVDAGTELDLDYIEDQLVALRGPMMYPEAARLRALVRAHR